MKPTGYLISILYAGQSCTSSSAAVDRTTTRKLEDCGGGSTGLSWCPELDECIQSWAEVCPVEGEKFSGSTQLVCDGGRCSSGEEKCTWTMGSATMAAYYFGDLDGPFQVPEGCDLTCDGCVESTSVSSSNFVGVPNPASSACIEMNGTISMMYESSGEYGVCMFDDGTACEEWSLFRGECAKGSRPILSKFCADNAGVLTNRTVDQGDVDGATIAEFQVCTIGDVECLESSYYSTGCKDEEHDCGGGSTGMSWCPAKNMCIQPWAETCPIDGENFPSSTELVCDEGQCSSGDEKCTYSEGSMQLATYYFNDLNGDFITPCELNCTGCTLATGDDASGGVETGEENDNGSVDDCGSGSTGMSWCPAKNMCIQPWAETCPIYGETFPSSTELVCDEGQCSSGDEKCTYSEGSMQLATYYFNDIDGDFITPCELNCTGCTLPTGDDASGAVETGEESNKGSVETLGSDSSASSRLVNDNVKLTLFAVLSYQIIGFFISW